jgi:uncharacterized protein YyaL (SSP411 family)
MERESFEDEKVARLMNQTFISIKVDREERPDIDNVYMTICQMMTGGGGWPLTIIMTPEKKPFFAGTYFPKDSGFGRIGMMELIPQVAEAWKDRREELLGSADRVVAALRQASGASPGVKVDGEVLGTGFRQLVQLYDPEQGGFGSAPKFPTPHRLLFLLRYWKRTGNERALEIVEKTLGSMRNGGIWDHVGFGFHRYSTDREWLVPHFEKMLYDQALLAMVYTEAYQATGRSEYKRTASEVFEYVLRDMKSIKGGFYSAEDADSEGEEGKFYLWTESELRQVLGEADLEPTIKAFSVDRKGNYLDESIRRKTGANILHRTRSTAAIAAELGVSEHVLARRLTVIREKLFAAREKRIRPHKDDKILTDWNGLMIVALAKAARAFDEPAYAEAATTAANFMLATMRKPDGRLLHRFRDGDTAVDAHVDDYAFFTWALIELYETTFDIRHLKVALELNDELLTHFWDDAAGGFFFAASDAEVLLARQKQTYDGAVPSGNSVAMLNMLRLARMTADVELEKKAYELGRAFSGEVSRHPASHAMMLCAIDFALGPSHEVVIAGEAGAEDTKVMLRLLREHFVPNKVVLLRPIAEGLAELTSLAAFTVEQKSEDGKATAYVCVDHSCSLPTTDPDRLMELLDPRGAAPDS